MPLLSPSMMASLPPDFLARLGGMGLPQMGAPWERQSPSFSSGNADSRQVQETLSRAQFDLQSKDSELKASGPRLAGDVVNVMQAAL